MGDFFLRYSMIVVAVIAATPAVLAWKSGTYKAMGERRKEFLESTAKERQAIVDRLVEDLENARIENRKLQEDARLLRQDLKAERDDCAKRRGQLDAESRAHEAYIAVLEQALRREGKELPIRPESRRDSA